MNSKHVKGLAVVSIADGAKVGTIDGAFLDPATKRVVGFSLASGGGLLGGGEPAMTIDVDEIHSLGPDAMTVDSAAAARGAQTTAAAASLVDLDELTKRKVLTEGGTLVGGVVSADFDEKTFRLTQIEASPGFFKTNKHIPIDQVTSIGNDIVVVADAVCAVEGDAEGTTQRAEGRFVVGDVATTE